ncbi:hypothetical protein CMUS01_15500 [Colletotrichum musicola]|uniref:Uncharacterized protein n=1 Tax=Colletotrichum musicola TaxID=2175873 RepID=A0A8H6IVX6_9PEZI|nr:hypothetical protein CMUS01_15500 [Colletotrichum musicola]
MEAMDAKERRPRAGADNESSKSWIESDWIGSRSNWRGLDQTGLDSNRNCGWAGVTAPPPAETKKRKTRRQGLDRLVSVVLDGAGCADGRNWGILAQVLVVVVPAGAVPMLEHWNLSRTTHTHNTTSLEPTVHPPWGVRPIEAQQQRQRSRSFDQRRHSKPRTSDHTADSGPAEVEQQMHRLETREVQTHRRTLE